MTSDFRERAWAKAEEIADAYLEADPVSIVVSANAQALEYLIPQWYTGLMSLHLGDSEAAFGAAGALQAGIDGLQQHADDQRATVIEEIRDHGMDGWRSAATGGFGEYINSLEDAVESQWRLGVALQSLIHLQGTYIDAAHEHAMDIADSTIAALKKAAAERDRHFRQILGEFVKTAAAALGGALTGGAAGGVVAAIGAVGGVFGKAVEGPAGDDPPAIIDAMNRAIAKAADGVTEDGDRLAQGIAAVRERLAAADDPHHRLRPKPIGKLPTGGERRIESNTG